jgi:aminoglycoside 6-adenylyltransferase
MRTEKEVFLHFKKWAKNNDLIRAAVLTSSRANPEAEVDFLSDYDI